MENYSPLRLALRLNAGFSSLSALIILFTHASLGDAMGIASPILVAVAVGLGAFAGHLVYTAARTDAAKLRAESLRHSISDFVWVAGSVALILARVLTATGSWILAAVAIPVLVLGILQWRALPAPATEGLVAEA